MRWMENLVTINNSSERAVLVSLGIADSLASGAEFLAPRPTGGISHDAILRRFILAGS